MSGNVETGTAESPQRKHNRDHTDRLFLDHVRQKVRTAAILDELQATQCPFSPQITPRASRHASKSREDRFERLYSVAAQMKEKLEVLKKKTEVNPECSFSPKITPKAARRNREASATFDRLYETAERKQVALGSRRQELKGEYSFSPRTNNKKSNVGRNAIPQTTTPDKTAARLYPGQEKLDELKQKKVEKAREYELRECTFQPSINPFKLKVKSKMKPLHERQELILARREARRQELKLEVERATFAECTFNPFPGEQKQINQKELSRLVARLYSDAKRIEARKKLLREHYFTTAQQKSHVQKHLESWDMDRWDFLHELGAKKIAEKIASSKDASRQHSLDKEREGDDLRNCTFSPKLSPLSVKIDALLLDKYDPEEAKSPRHIRLFNDAQKLRERMNQLQIHAEEEALESASTAHTSMSPTFRKAGKLRSDVEQTARLYEDARRIEERKERLYHQFRLLEKQKANVRFNALTIDTVEKELKSSGPLSPRSVLSSKSMEAQDRSFAELHARHEAILKAKHTIQQMHENDLFEMSKTKFNSKTVHGVDRKRVRTPSTFDTAKAREIILQVKPVTSPESVILSSPLSPRKTVETQRAKFIEELDKMKTKQKETSPSDIKKKEKKRPSPLFIEETKATGEEEEEQQQQQQSTTPISEVNSKDLDKIEIESVGTIELETDEENDLLDLLQE